MNKRLLLLFITLFIGLFMIYLGLQENNINIMSDIHNNEPYHISSKQKIENEVLKEVIPNNPSKVIYDNKSRITYIYYNNVSSQKVMKDMRINENK